MVLSQITVHKDQIRVSAAAGKPGPHPRPLPEGEGSEAAKNFRGGLAGEGTP